MPVSYHFTRRLPFHYVIYHRRFALPPVIPAHFMLCLMPAFLLPPQFNLTVRYFLPPSNGRAWIPSRFGLVRWFSILPVLITMRFAPFSPPHRPQIFYHHPTLPVRAQRCSVTFAQRAGSTTTCLRHILAYNAAYTVRFTHSLPFPIPYIPTFFYIPLPFPQKSCAFWRRGK